jgi:glycosyl hydrolase family 26
MRLGIRLGIGLGFGLGFGAAVTSLLVAVAMLAPNARADAAGDPDRERDRDPAPFGAFLGSGPGGIERSARLERWLDGTPVTVGHTYLPGDLWSNIEGRPAFLEPWAEWRREKDDRLFVLNVPMLERNEGDVPDPRVRTLLSAGAQGRYDHHFRTLAERLVRLGLPDTVIVLGWEMNGATYTHRCEPNPRAWRTYWRGIVTTMRKVPGQKFRFDFAPARGRDTIGWEECYPGDDVVDIIGLDSYDQPAGQDFDESVSQPYGLRHHAEFADEHDKPISFPEWGLFRNGDNPGYMRRMLEWIAEHRPVYHTISDYCPHGVWRCARNPESSAVFHATITGSPAEPVTDPDQDQDQDQDQDCVPIPFLGCL